MRVPNVGAILLSTVSVKSNNMSAQIEPVKIIPLFYNSARPNNYGAEPLKLQALVTEPQNPNDDEER